MIERILDWLVETRGEANLTATIPFRAVTIFITIDGFQIDSLARSLKWLIEHGLRCDQRKQPAFRDGYQWFPREVTSEEREQKFSTDDVSLSISAVIPQTLERRFFSQASKVAYYIEPYIKRRQPCVKQTRRLGSLTRMEKLLIALNDIPYFLQLFKRHGINH